MNMNTSLPNAILSFAFTGVLGPHASRWDYAAPRPTPTPSTVVPFPPSSLGRSAR